MKIIYNDTIPFKGFKAVTILPFIFVRSDCRFTDVDRNHEEIHGAQQKEMLPIGMALTAILLITGCGWWSLLGLPVYYWWYLTEWIVRGMVKGFAGEWWQTKKAYRAISFEREAYFFEKDHGYLERRPHFVWMRYLTKKYD